MCAAPSLNGFCVDLDRIRAAREDAREDELAGEHFADVPETALPPCIAESGAFMSDREWWRVVEHPYQDSKDTKDSHGILRPTRLSVPPYSTFVIPFLWMLRNSQKRLDEELPFALPPDEEPPFRSAWVYGRERQVALGKLFFDQVQPNESLIFFYTKGGHPLEEGINRLVVGMGHVTKVGKQLTYDTTGAHTYPVWDRIVSHSIRPDKAMGFLLPYHDYLEESGDPDEDARRRTLLQEIAVLPEQSQIASFSYAGEHSTADVALATLVKALESVRRIKAHGIANGPWDEREGWLNDQIAQTWKERGAFPGTGAALEALGLRLGTALAMELLSAGTVGSLDDPWPVLDAIIRGARNPPQKAYAAGLEAIRNTWSGLSDERRALLKLLSRFSLSAEQASRWFEPKERHRATRAEVSDHQILENPYRIAETDLGAIGDYPVSIGVLDRGLFADTTVAAKHPVPAPSHVGVPNDVRRVRAALVAVLRAAAADGDTLLSQSEALGRLEKLDLTMPCAVPADWLSGNAREVEHEIALLSLPAIDPSDTDTPCLQLVDLKDRELKLASILARRAEKEVPSLKENWPELLVQAITDAGGTVSANDVRHKQALREQAGALERVTTRRLSTLVGRAGTGKTTVLGALLKSTKLSSEGVLFLAPTGKARVRITQQTNQTAMTVAQFLYQLKRYDGARQRPLFSGKEQYKKEQTVVIDECSMLTLDDLYAVLMALDLAHVRRIILVGDPNQLPPIGVGRPFADLVAHLDAATKGSTLDGALARLTVELRTSQGGPSDTLRLASWYTREPQSVDADRVLSELELGETFNDLSIVFWQGTQQLHERLDEQVVHHLKLRSPADVEGFNSALGLTKEGWIPFAGYDGAERFQILSPVRLHPYGVLDLNRLIQARFRRKQLESGRNRRGVRLGDEEIVWGDKVILTQNGRREGWGRETGNVEEYLANGEIGVAGQGFGGAKFKLLN